MKRFDAAGRAYEKASQVTRELIVLDPKNRRSWYLLGKIQLDLGWMHLRAGKPSKAYEAFLASNEGFARGLEMDPTDTVILECRTGQFEELARAVWASGDIREARRWMQQCFEVIRQMVRRDPSVRSYIDDYADKLKFAQKIGVSTADLE
jgi:hypothetical protein